MNDAIIYYMSHVLGGTSLNYCSSFETVRTLKASLVGEKGTPYIKISDYKHFQGLPEAASRAHLSN